MQRHATRKIVVVHALSVNIHILLGYANDIGHNCNTGDHASVTTACGYDILFSHLCRAQVTCLLCTAIEI